MDTRDFRRILLTAVVSTAAFGAAAGVALAQDVSTIYGRSSEPIAMGAPLNAAIAQDASNTYGRSSAYTEPAASQARYDVTFKLVRGVNENVNPTVNGWLGRAAAPMDQSAAWKITAHEVAESGSPNV